MDRQPVELDAAVLHAVKPSLESGGLVSLPFGQQLGQPRLRDAVLPIVAEPRAELSVSKPSPETVKRSWVKGDLGSGLHGQVRRLLVADRSPTDPCASRRTGVRADAQQICRQTRSSPNS
jgi:hypothetical protein